MRITVRGLDRRIPEDRYYLTVEIPNDGYDFVGNPTAGTARVRRTGAFRDNGDFSTDEAFNLIHTDPAVSPAGGVTVNLYEKALGRSARSPDRFGDRRRRPSDLAADGPDRQSVNRSE